MKRYIKIIMILSILFFGSFLINKESKATTDIEFVHINNVVVPRPGNKINKNVSVSSNEGWKLDSRYNTKVDWVDITDKKKQICMTDDSKFVEGHYYMVRIWIEACDGYQFNTQKKIYSFVNDCKADIYMINIQGVEEEKKYRAVEYTFPMCERELIDQIDIVTRQNKKIGPGEKIDNYVYTTETKGVYANIYNRWYYNGKKVSNGKFQYGKYKSEIILEVDSAYYISHTTIIRLDGKKLGKILKVSDTYYQVNAPSDLYNFVCDPHEIGDEWKSDSLNHWKECMECKEKTNIQKHTFGDPIPNGLNKTNYVCSTCGYVKTENGDLDGFTYEECEDGIEISRYLGDAHEVTIPNVVNGKNVVSIGANCFSNKQSINQVTIPSTVTRIREYAFSGCSAITSITLPEGLEEIEESTFDGCTMLMNINIPKNVKKIGKQAFNRCSKLKSSIIPCGVTEIGQSAFADCSTLTSIVIPDTVTKLGSYAFARCSKIQSAVVGSGITVIPQSCFDTCTLLNTVTVSSNLTSIAIYAFADSGLNTINYEGEDWSNNIEVKAHNDPISSATINEKYTEKTDVGQHNYQYFQKANPTCIDKGYTIYICDGCGNVKKDDYVLETGIHEYNDGTIITEPKCFENGVKTYICNNCGDSYDEVIPQIGYHSWDNGKIDPPATHDSDGVKTYNCTTCGDTCSEPVGYVYSITSVENIKDKTYTGNEITQDLIIKDNEYTLKEGYDYIIDYKNNINAGTANLEIIGGGYYQGQKINKTFKINKANYNMSNVKFANQTVTYDGKAHSIVATGIPKGVSVSYVNNGMTNAGKYTVTAKFTGDAKNYNVIANKTATLTINKANYNMSNVKFTNQTVTYDGKAHSIVATGMPQGISVSYVNNGMTNAGKYTVTAKFTGDAKNYNVIANKTATLTINKANYNMSNVKFANQTVTYDGKAHSIVATGMPQGIQVKYTNNGKTDVGTYKITASFVCNDTKNYNTIPNKTAVLKITAKDIKNAEISGINEKEYTGKNLKQKISLKLNKKELKNGKDYTIKYSNNKLVGKATITIKGKNNYTGTIKKTFNIKPQGTIITKVKSLINGFNVIWKKNKKQTSGYQIQYSTDKNFKSNKKNVNVSKNTITEQKIKKLKANKKYYIRIRTYKKQNGKMYYSKWSDIQKVKIKK